MVQSGRTFEFGGPRESRQPDKNKELMKDTQSRLTCNDLFCGSLWQWGTFYQLAIRSQGGANRRRSAG